MKSYNVLSLFKKNIYSKVKVVENHLMNKKRIIIKCGKKYNFIIKIKLYN